MPRADLLHAAENELEKLRRLVAGFVGVIHDPAYDYDTRRAIAIALGLPEPAHQTVPETP
ncbi:hypothetical protein [Streptomyces misionensis]|uniref:hypothetical protein n=1 Tax=Streptomyces misionensis TaxID=67331 RepID=UPI00396B9D71